MQKSEIAFQIEKRITGIEAELAELRRLVQELDSGSKKQKHMCEVCSEPIQKYTALPCGCSVHKRCLNVKDFTGNMVLSTVCTVCATPLPAELRESIIKNKDNLQKARQVKKGMSKAKGPMSPQRKGPVSVLPTSNERKGPSVTLNLENGSPRYNR